tara:strand:+ start:1099 stop:1506 length:408 start_codon:yes stop_codon:yes gene_type:complete
MKAAQMAAIEHMTGDVYRVGCDIERELNAANVEIEEKRKDIVYLATEKAKLEERIKRLEEMYEGEPGERPDLLGSNVMGLLKRELNSAQQRIKRLEEAGDDLYANCDLSRWDSTATTARKLSDQNAWRKSKEAKL